MFENPHRCRLGKETMTSRARRERVDVNPITKSGHDRRSFMEGTSQKDAPQIVEPPQDEYYVTIEQYFNATKEHCSYKEVEHPEKHGLLVAPQHLVLFS